MAVLKFDKRLKSILLKRGVLTEEVLGEALSKADKDDSSFTKVLLEDDYLKEEDLLTALSEETHLPPIDVFKVQPDESLSTLLPENLAKYYGVIPIAKLGNVLTLAAYNPFDILQLDDIQIVTGCEIRPVLSTEVSIRAAIPELYNKGQKMVNEILDNMSVPDVEVKEAQPKDLPETAHGKACRAVGGRLPTNGDTVQSLIQEFWSVASLLNILHGPELKLAPLNKKSLERLPKTQMAGISMG